MEVKQEPEDPFTKEYKMDFEDHLIPNVIGKECWNYDKIQSSCALKNELVPIKQENETNPRIDNLQQACVEVKSEIEEIINDTDIRCDSIQLSDIKQSKPDADEKDEIEIVDHELKKELDEIGKHGNLFNNIDDLKLCSNEMVIGNGFNTDQNHMGYKICSKDSLQRQSENNGKSLESECCSNKHLCTHTGENPDICSSSFTQTGHSSTCLCTPPDEKPFICTVCKKAFSRKGDLKIHLRNHTGEKPFKCNVCTKYFSVKGDLNSHLRTHTAEKPFECSVCKKSFSQKGNLENHLRIHTGEKPFKCNICSKSFSKKSNLNRHLLIHTGEKPFKCNVCTKSFSVKGDLSNHLRTHSAEKPFTCNICTKSFRRKATLKYHLRIHTDEIVIYVPRTKNCLLLSSLQG